MMNILFIIDSIPCANGKTFFCMEVLNRLAEDGASCRLLLRREVSNPYYTDKRIGVFVRDINKVFADGWKPDIAHVHGIWYPWLARMQWHLQKNGIPVIISPQGMLCPWTLHSKYLKKLVAMVLYQKKAIRNVDYIHTTAEFESKSIRALGFTNPFIEVPIGISLPKDASRIATEKKRILFVSRLNFRKGLINLIDAWKEAYREEWELVIAGPSDGNFGAKIKAHAKCKGVFDRIVFIDEVLGDVKDKLYRSADVFVLPTYSENFGIVVPEAMSYGLPVITTNGAPWHELEERNCGKWIDIGVEPLVQALHEMMSMTDAERTAMGARGRTLVEERYLWDAVVERIVKEYKWIAKEL